jgi:hypothetical protein
MIDVSGFGGQQLPAQSPGAAELDRSVHAEDMLVNLPTQPQSGRSLIVSLKRIQRNLVSKTGLAKGVIPT